MKKLMVLALVFALVATMGGIVGLAADTQSYGQAKWVDINAISIDATKKDDLLANALMVEVTDIFLPGYERDNHATGKFWYLWNEAGIYVFAEVKDVTPTTIPPLPAAVLSADPTTHAWNRDSIEVFIEPNNGTEMADAFAYSLSPNGEAYMFSFSLVDDENMGAPHEQGTQMRDAAKPYIDFAARYDPSDNTVYYIEMFLKQPGIGYQAGQKVGTMITIDDVETGGTDFSDAGPRAIYGTPSGSGDANVWAIADHYYIELSAESAMPPPPAVVEEPEPAASEAAAPPPEDPAPQTPAAPKTGDMDIVVLFAFVVFALGAAFVLRKKKI